MESLCQFFGNFIGGLLWILFGMLVACGYFVLAFETAIFLFKRARPRFFSNFASIGMTLAAGFVLVGVSVGTNSELLLVGVPVGLFTLLAPPIRLVLILQEECKGGAEEARLLYALSLALISFPSVVGLLSIVCGLGLGLMNLLWSVVNY